MALSGCDAYLSLLLLMPPGHHLQSHPVEKSIRLFSYLLMLEPILSHQVDNQLWDLAEILLTVLFPVQASQRN